MSIDAVAETMGDLAETAVLRRCDDCNRHWRPGDKEYDPMGLRLRRIARRAGVARSWAHPRPHHRCPSCCSTATTLRYVMEDEPLVGPALRNALHFPA